MRAASSTRWVGMALLSVAAGLVGVGGPVSFAAAAPRAGLEPGQVVVTDQESGEVLAVAADGADTVLLDDLGAVRGVVVLSDGAVLAVDSDAGSIVGTGGRFGDERVEVATGLESPEGLAVAGGGRLYVTSFSEGTLSRVDISSGQVAGLAAGLEGPAAVVPLRAPWSPNHVAVAEWFGGKVGEVRRDGERTGTLARGLERPAGLAVDGDGTLFVSDRDAGEILALTPDGTSQVVAEVDAPVGLALDPPAPAPGQDYDLVAATAAGVQRIDVATGEATVVNDLPTTVGVAVAPDEFIVAGATATTVADGGADGAAGGGDQVASGVDGREVDPVMVALVALAVFLLGVAMISGIQLWRGRGDDDVSEDRYAGLSRQERRRARRTDRAVAAAERKTAKEIDKAEKRAAKLAPDPPPGGEPTGASADGPGRKERRAAERAAKEEAKQAEVNAKRRSALEAQQRRRDAVLAKADAKQAKADAKAKAKAEARGRAKGTAADPTEPAASAAGAPSWPAGPSAPLGVERAPGLAGPEPAAGGAATEAPVGARSPLFAPPAAPITAGPFLESLFVDDAAGERPATPEGSDAATGPAAAPTPEPPVEPGAGAGDAPEPALSHPFASEPAPAEVEPAGASPLPPQSEAPAPAGPVPAPPASAPVAAAPAGVAVPATRTALEADREPDEPPVDLSEQVAREVPPPRGVRGRRKAKRRIRAAEHRHRQLRAITAILDVPQLALPPAPVRRAIGVSSAASVAVPPSALGGPPVPPAALGPAAAPAADPAAEPASSAPGDGPAVPWPGDGAPGDPSAAWPGQPTH